MKTFKLQPINGRKSFNRKCHVNEFTNNSKQVISELMSYNTKVAEYNHNKNMISLTSNKDNFTNTTLTHIRAFLDFYGFDSMTKKEMLNFKNKI